ncbi:Fc.00g083860.m01.CDS01 [Cosmosporella sp. VM-42]
MSSASFIFLNATGTPDLSQSDAKLMRGHITRTNFANRRHRISQGGNTKKRPKKVALIRKGPGLLTQDATVDALTADLPLATPPKNPYHYIRFLSRFWSLVFLDGSDYPNSPDEDAMIHLLVSEAALAEVSMSIGLRHWSPDASCQERAAALSFSATNIIVQRINSGAAHTGGVLGAVLSMAIGERLMHNDLHWKIHVDGLANLITERRSQGECDLPPMLSNFLILSVYVSSAT